MAILNRDLDVSQQRDYLTWAAGLPAQGATFTIANGPGYVATAQTLVIFGPMPYQYALQSINAITNGASGAPQLVPTILRAMNGGVTAIAVSISNMVIANSASFLSGSTGSLVYSGLAPQGSTLLIGQRGDMIQITTAVANTACSALLVQMVVKRVQDIVQMDGV